MSRAFPGLLRTVPHIARAFLWSCVLLVPLVLMLGAPLRTQQAAREIDDVTGKYQFLKAEDTLALLDEEGRLKGYIDVLQGEDESDAVLSYPITIGSRKRNQVEFKTGKIHQRYYRFTGIVERGKGQKEKDPDYLRLVGDLGIVTVNSETGEESVEQMRVVFKSLGKTEASEE